MTRYVLAMLLLGSIANADPGPTIVTHPMLKQSHEKVHGCVVKPATCGPAAEAYANLKKRCGFSLGYFYDDDSLKGALSYDLDFLAVTNGAFAAIEQLCQPADKATLDVFEKQIKTVQFVWDVPCDVAVTSPAFAKNKCRKEGPTYEIKRDVLVVSLRGKLPDYTADLYGWLKKHL